VHAFIDMTLTLLQVHLETHSKVINIIKKPKVSL